MTADQSRPQPLFPNTVLDLPNRNTDLTAKYCKAQKTPNCER
eukprot:COSAG02_NODE_58635_length_276_cov_1.740113_1_plen_41_part_10